MKKNLIETNHPDDPPQAERRELVVSDSYIRYGILKKIFHHLHFPDSLTCPDEYRGRMPGPKTENYEKSYYE